MMGGRTSPLQSGRSALEDLVSSGWLVGKLREDSLRVGSSCIRLEFPSSSMGDPASIKENTLGRKILIAVASIAAAIGLFSLNSHRALSAGVGVTSIAGHPLAPKFSLPELTGQALDLSADQAF